MVAAECNAEERFSEVSYGSLRCLPRFATFADPMSESVKVSSSKPHAEGFDPVVLWLRHRNLIVLCGVVLLAATVIVGGYLWHKASTTAKASAAYMGAKTAEEFQKASAEYPTTVAGQNADLMAAQRLAEAGKTEESLIIVRKFLETHDKHPLAAGAALNIGALLEVQNKEDDALTAYQNTTTKYPLTYAAAAAWMAQGRILKSKNRSDEARRAFENVVANFPDSSFANEAKRLLKGVTKAPAVQAIGTAAPAEAVKPAEAPAAAVAPEAAKPAVPAAVPVVTTPAVEVAPAAAKPEAAKPAEPTPAAAVTPEAAKPAEPAPAAAVTPEAAKPAEPAPAAATTPEAAKPAEPAPAAAVTPEAAKPAEPAPAQN